MARFWTALEACPLPVKFTLVSVLGFATDATLLHLMIEVGLTPAIARIVSLLSAMQVTFLVNGLLVFRCLDRARPWRQWATYMVSHGLGNLCNYWIFVTLLSLHRLPLSKPLAALAVSSVMAWGLNYVAARYLVFRDVQVRAARVTPFAGRPHDGRGSAAP
jgi:putative flippase GtrA